MEKLSGLKLDDVSRGMSGGSNPSPSASSDGVSESGLLSRVANSVGVYIRSEGSNPSPVAIIDWSRHGKARGIYS